MSKNNDLKLKYDQALQKFIKKYEKQSNVVAIIISGSYVHSKLDKNSDLDVYIILKKSKTRERGNTWINGIEIEYFINPVNQIKHYFTEEQKNKSFATARMFANSVILHQKNKTINYLIKEAKNIVNKKNTINNFEIELAKYYIDDIKKDIEDVYLRKDVFTFNMMANELILKSIDIIYGIKKVPREKMKRGKKLRKNIKDIDPIFEKLFSAIVLETNINKKFFTINKLISYVEKLLGGKRPQEWQLRSKCDYATK